MQKIQRLSNESSHATMHSNISYSLCRAASPSVQWSSQHIHAVLPHRAAAGRKGTLRNL